MANHDRDEEAIRDEQTVSTLAWFITGAIVGVTAAILYAPQSGKKTRRYISDKAQEGREAMESAGQEIADVSRDMFERGRKLVEDAADLFERGRKLVKG